MRRFPRLALWLPVAVACKSASPHPSGAPSDTTTHPADAAPPPVETSPPVDEAACIAALDADWKAHPPTTGIASSGSAASYDAVIGKIMADYAIPGGAVAVVKDGRLVFAKGYGLADVDAQQPAHADALFRVASLTKQLTAFAILTLVEAGKLSLDNKPFALLSDLTPAPGDAKNAQLLGITVRNLLQHTGGWNRDSTFDPMFQSVTIAKALGEGSPPSCHDIARFMLGEPLQYAPGSTYDYSNFGYCVLGRVVEKVSGVAYADYVESAILEKAGVHDAAIGRSLADGRADHEVAYYDYPSAPLAQNVFDPSGAQVPWPYGGFDLEAMDSHGAWILSPIDLLRVQIVTDARPSPADLLASSSFDALTANPKVGNGNTDGSATPYVDSPAWYGFGFSINTAGNWWHTGSLPGTATEVVRAQNGFGWAAFFDTRPGDQNTFFSRLDGDLWTALDGAKGDFVKGDLFPSYADDFTDFMSESDFASRASTELAAGRFPVRIEGAIEGGASAYRARFGVKPPVSAVDFATGLTCSELRSKDAAHAGYAHASLQWFTDAAGERRYQVAWAKP